MLNMIHHRYMYMYLVMSACLFSVVIFLRMFLKEIFSFPPFWHKYCDKNGLFLTKLGYCLPLRFFPDKFGKMQHAVVVNKCM